MKSAILTVLNLGLLVVFFYLMRRPGLLSFSEGGRVWLTWLAVAVITLMDEFTSIFYVPAESYRFIGVGAIVFIVLTSLLVRFLTTRLTEIAEILEHHNIIGGGVYSFSYLVLGPVVSFIAVSSIMVDYILTACISAVSAVANALSFFPGLSASFPLTISLVLSIIWLVAGLNILGIRENARFTFGIFIFAAFIMVNLIASGILALDAPSLTRMKDSVHYAAQELTTDSWLTNYGNLVSNIAFCILAYSGVESVLQTAGLIRGWREIHRAYWFLALTVGISTPLISALVLSAPIDFKQHEGDLITHYASLLNGVPFGILVATLASFTLTMAVNTAFVASSELLERVAHRYGFSWLIATNKRQSLYRIHLISALLFSIIILITHGSQQILADMYAIGLVASFCINLGSLLIYRYSKGTKEVIAYFTSRLGTLILWVILVSCFIFLALDKPHGTLLWASVTLVVLLAGILMAQKRAPEIMERQKTDAQMDLVLYLSQSDAPELQLVFRRPKEETLQQIRDNQVFISFYNPREKAPAKLAPNHFRFVLTKAGLFNDMIGLLKVVEYEFPDRTITVTFGWPMSSWLDRLAIGVMVFNLMRLPRLFPQFNFNINYPGKTGNLIQ